MLPWPAPNALQAQRMLHTCPLPAAPAGVSTSSCCMRQSWMTRGTWGVLTPAPGSQHCTLALCWRWKDFFLSLLLAHLVQRLRGHTLWEQNGLIVGPVFIYLQPFMKGVWSALCARSKKLIDSHFWWLSHLLWLSQRHDFSVSITHLEHVGSLKHFEWKGFYCQSTWYVWMVKVLETSSFHWV